MMALTDRTASHVAPQSTNATKAVRFHVAILYDGVGLDSHAEDTMRGLAARLEQIARENDGAFVAHDEALRIVFGLTPGNGCDPIEVAAARRRLYSAITTLKDSGRIRTQRGAFASPLAAVAAVEELPPDVEPPELAPSTPARRIAAYHANRIMAMANAFVAAIHEEVSDCHRDLGMEQRAAPIEEPPVGYRVTRYASTNVETLEG